MFFVKRDPRNTLGSLDGVSLCGRDHDGAKLPSLLTPLPPCDFLQVRRLRDLPVRWRGAFGRSFGCFSRIVGGGCRQPLNLHIE
jgi:hypothetical protein